MEWTLLAQAEEGSPTDALVDLGALTLADWLWAGALILGAVIIGLILKRILRRMLVSSAGVFVARLVGRMVAFGVIAIGFVYALNQVGVSIAPLLGVLGIAGLALALAFQDILENFIAGVLISVRKPFTAGDQITTVGYSGVVEEIDLRAIQLRTYEGERVFIPNATVWKEPMENHTLLGPRRTRLDVGVNYATDLERATKLIIDAVSRVDGVETDPAPEAFVHQFGDSSIDIAVRFWHQPETRHEWMVRDAVAKRIKATLDEAGIGIPFPQRVVHFATDLTTRT